MTGLHYTMEAQLQQIFQHHQRVWPTSNTRVQLEVDAAPCASSGAMQAVQLIIVMM